MANSSEMGSLLWKACLQTSSWNLLGPGRRKPTFNFQNNLSNMSHSASSCAPTHTSTPYIIEVYISNKSQAGSKSSSTTTLKWPLKKKENKYQINYTHSLFKREKGIQEKKLKPRTETIWSSQCRHNKHLTKFNTHS